jgi:hypothetical protein
VFVIGKPVSDALGLRGFEEGPRRFFHSTENVL